MLSAAELHRRGRQHMHQGRFSAARRDLQQALRRDPDPERHARILVTLSFVTAEQGDTDQGLEMCRRAREVTDDVDVLALVTSQEATLHQRRGDYVLALELYSQSIDALPAGSAERANCLNDRGVLRLRLDDYAAAERDLEAAARIFELHGDDVGHASAVHNQGYAAMRRGDLVDALALMERARPNFALGSEVALAVVDQDRAEALLAAGMPTSAVELLRSCADIHARHHLRQMQAEAEFVAARALLPLDRVSARHLARRARNRFRRRGSTTWSLRSSVIDAVAQATDQRMGTAWFERTDLLAAELRSHMLLHEAQLLDLHGARAAIRVDRLDVARERLRRARTNSRDSLTERILERAVKAELSVAVGRRRQALRHLRAGLDLLHDWQATFGSLDLMSSVVGHGRGLATSGIRLALEDGTPELVFEWSERARALTTRVVPVRPPKDEQVAADLIEIRTLTVTEPDAGTREARRLAELREHVRQRAWLGAGSGEVNQIAELRDIETAIGDDTALVSYLWDGDARIHALVVTDVTRRVFDLGDSGRIRRLLTGLQADLDVSASDLGEAIGKVVLAGRQRRLSEVAEALVAPLLPQLGDRRVVITQAGVLAGTPWSMLPGLIGRPVTVASAATRWLGTKDLPVPEGIGFVAGPGVDRAVEEVKQSATRWSGASVLTDGAAISEAVLELAGHVDVLHVSAHGRHASEHPLFSGVLLADGPLFGYDLDQLTDVPDVVILSACEVGRSTQRWAEESLGMVNAWLHAGARCVIASPAAVADDEACEVLQDVHRLMAGGTPPGVALAQATHDRPTSFVCFGAGW